MFKKERVIENIIDHAETGDTNIDNVRKYKTEQACACHSLNSLRRACDRLVPKCQFYCVFLCKLKT